jgi:hypothetical protein
MLSRRYDSEHIYPNVLEQRQLGQTSVPLRPFWTSDRAQCREMEEVLSPHYSND